MSQISTSKKNNPLLVFGIGPVLDKYTRVPAHEAHTPYNDEDVPFWSHNLAIAAAKLYRLGLVDKIIILGGQTGGTEYRSEAELIKELIVDSHVPEFVVFEEKGSRETTENVINFLNEFVEDDADPSKLVVNILCAKYHTSRTALLMKCFAINVQYRFCAEEVIRYAASNENSSELLKELIESYDIWEAINASRVLKNATKFPDSLMNNPTERILNRLDDILNPNDHSPELTDEEEHSQTQKTFYQQQKGTERNNYHNRLEAEALWTREILTMPERILFESSEIKNDGRIQEIIKVSQNAFRDRLSPYHFHLEKDTPQELREKMKKFPWPYPTGRTTHEVHHIRQMYLDDWKEEHRATGMPEHLVERAERFDNYQLYKSQ